MKFNFKKIDLNNWKIKSHPPSPELPKQSKVNPKRAKEASSIQYGYIKCETSAHEHLRMGTVRFKKYDKETGRRKAGMCENREYDGLTVARATKEATNK